MGGKNKILTGIFIVGCVLIIGVATVVKAVSSENFGNDDVMYNGIEIDGVDVSGMTEKEAQTAIDKHISDLKSRPVKIIINNKKSVDTTFAQLGFSHTGDDHVSEAFQIGKTGNVIERLFNSVSDEDKKYTLDYTLDKSAVEKFVNDKCTVFNVKAKNSKLTLKENGKFKTTKSRIGLKLQVDETVDKIISVIDGNKDNSAVEIEAVVKTKKPKYPRKLLSRCKDMIGTYSTSYSSSTSSRMNNIQTAAKYINGTILYPGQVFSTVKVIKDRTEENGYQYAPEYSSGKVVDGIGGGVCQVSTTLYNAVLNAELKVTERSPHSMVVAYVDVSRDAAISGDYKDLKFKNNTDAPIYIWADASGGVLSFKIYGEETRPKKRKIEFVSEILETIQPGEDIVIEDKSLPSYYRSVTQSAHTGYRAKLWKVIYINDVEKERVEVNTSTYNAEPQHVTIGNQTPVSTPAPATPEPEPEPEPSKEPEETDETDDDIDDADDDTEETDETDENKKPKKDKNKDNEEFIEGNL